MRKFPQAIECQLVQEALLFLMWGILPPCCYSDLALLEDLWTIDLLWIL